MWRHMHGPGACHSQLACARPCGALQPWPCSRRPLTHHHDLMAASHRPRLHTCMLHAQRTHVGARGGAAAEPASELCRQRGGCCALPYVQQRVRDRGAPVPCMCVCTAPAGHVMQPGNPGRAAMSVRTCKPCIMPISTFDSSHMQRPPCCCCPATPAGLPHPLLTWLAGWLAGLCTCTMCACKAAHSMHTALNRAAPAQSSVGMWLQHASTDMHTQVPVEAPPASLLFCQATAAGCTQAGPGLPALLRVAGHMPAHSAGA